MCGTTSTHDRKVTVVVGWDGNSEMGQMYCMTEYDFYAWLFFHTACCYRLDEAAKDISAKKSGQDRLHRRQLSKMHFKGGNCRKIYRLRSKSRLEKPLSGSVCSRRIHDSIFCFFFIYIASNANVVFRWWSTMFNLPFSDKSNIFLFAVSCWFTWLILSLHHTIPAYGI